MFVLIFSWVDGVEWHYDIVRRILMVWSYGSG
jgi:hypothetical protein